MKKFIHWYFSPRILLISGSIQLVGWLIMTVIAQFTPLGDSVKYVTFISHFALVLTSLGLIQTALVDKKAEEDRESNDS
jgi:hypothetical protein